MKELEPHRDWLSLEGVEYNGPGIAYLFATTGHTIDLVGAYQGNGWFRGLTLENRHNLAIVKPVQTVTTIRHAVHEHAEVESSPGCRGSGLRPNRYAGAIEMMDEPADFTHSMLNLLVRWYTQCITEGSTFAHAGLDEAEARNRLAFYQAIRDDVNSGGLSVNKVDGSIAIE